MFGVCIQGFPLNPMSPYPWSSVIIRITLGFSLPVPVLQEVSAGAKMTGKRPVAGRRMFLTMLKGDITGRFKI
jgi:hypothetical protein